MMGLQHPDRRASACHLTSVFAGSLAPIIALWLLHTTGFSLPIYVAIACAISVLSALMAWETSGEIFAAIDAR